AYRVRLYGADGVALWTLDLAQLFSRQDHLEIQDVRYRDGVLYFNEACQSYASEARGRCSSLVAVEPTEAKVLWRTKPLVSNNRFLVEADLIVSGYGFTKERDYLYVIRRTDGKLMHRLRIPKAHEAIGRDDQGRLVVRLYPDAIHYFELYETRRGAPRLRPVGKR
ncbi:MAG: hypothetical protein QF464_03830, partial [Myxococcota bacterium]|nr:hypothetical protein [Myxococcota bacterium]